MTEEPFFVEINSPTYAAFFRKCTFMVFSPILYVSIYWRLYDRFIRCPQCRDWIGIDADDKGRMWRIGPDPRWVMIRRTGCCPKCGAQMIALEKEEETASPGDSPR